MNQAQKLIVQNYNPREFVRLWGESGIEFIHHSYKVSSNEVQKIVGSFLSHFMKGYTYKGLAYRVVNKVDLSKGQPFTSWYKTEDAAYESAKATGLIKNSPVLLTARVIGWDVDATINSEGLKNIETHGSKEIVSPKYPYGVTVTEFED